MTQKAKQTKPRGRNGGRKAADGAKGLVVLTNKVSPEQKEKFKTELGSAWLRRQIDLA